MTSETPTDLANDALALDSEATPDAIQELYEFVAWLEAHPAVTRALSMSREEWIALARDVLALSAKVERYEAMQATTPGVTAIAAERQRQVGVEGWSPQHDMEHAGGELAMAAESYVWAAVCMAQGLTRAAENAPATWPWRPEWWKPASQRRSLEKAGALIAAEIDRLDALREAEEVRE